MALAPHRAPFSQFSDAKLRRSRPAPSGVIHRPNTTAQGHTTVTKPFHAGSVASPASAPCDELLEVGEKGHRGRSLPLRPARVSRVGEAPKIKLPLWSTARC